jgi:hypothetical protein
MYLGQNGITKLNQHILKIKEELIMASNNNRVLVPQARQGLDTFKAEIASSLGHANYESIDKGNLTSRENGYVGGTMVKRMVEEYESKIK